MSITDELREWVRYGKGSLLAIADRIDAEYQKAIRELNNLADGCVLLPVDADGEYIRIGDVMENIVCPSVHREVTGVGVECFYGWDENNGRYSQFDVNCYRHHHAPTVEDVLREFYSRYCKTKPKKEDDAILAEYAAKLRLAGDAE